MIQDVGEAGPQLEMRLAVDGEGLEESSVHGIHIRSFDGTEGAVSKGSAGRNGKCGRIEPVGDGASTDRSQRLQDTIGSIAAVYGAGVGWALTIERGREVVSGLREVCSAELPAAQQACYEAIVVQQESTFTDGQLPDQV